MRICIISHEYPPFPGSDIASCSATTARELAAAGHDVHVVTNRDVQASSELKDRVDLWREGNLTVHRLELFDSRRKVSNALRFFEVNPAAYAVHEELWASDLSNLVAAEIAGFVASLHAVIQLDIIEVPQQFACGYYIIRHRNAGRRSEYPPVCLTGHTSTREALRLGGNIPELGRKPVRELMAREEYCLQHADALQTPTRDQMHRYEATCDDALPKHRSIVPNYVDSSETGSPASQAITAQKIELFERVVEIETQVKAKAAPNTSDTEPLPGQGLVVIDASGAEEPGVIPTIDCIAEATAGAPGWRVAVLFDDEQKLVLPAAWSRYRPADPAPWSKLGDADSVVWVRACTRFDPGGVSNLVRLVQNTPRAAGAFAWLRPPGIELFPYSQDGGFHTLLTEAAVIPPALCVTAARIKAIPDLDGVGSSAARICALMAVATLASDSSFVHTGKIEGDFYDDLSVVTRAERELALGFADALGLLPADVLTTYGKSATVMVDPTSSTNGLAPSEELKYLRQIHDEHMRVKNHRVVRVLRALKVFALLRRISPRSKRYLGSGKSD